MAQPSSPPEAPAWWRWGLEKELVDEEERAGVVEAREVDGNGTVSCSSSDRVAEGISWDSMFQDSRPS